MSSGHSRSKIEKARDVRDKIVQDYSMVEYACVLINGNTVNISVIANSEEGTQIPKYVDGYEVKIVSDSFSKN